MLVRLLCRRYDFEVSFGCIQMRYFSRVPIQRRVASIRLFSFEEVEAQRRPRAPGPGCQDWDSQAGWPAPKTRVSSPPRLSASAGLQAPEPTGSVSSILALGFPGRHVTPGSFRVWALPQIYGPAEQLGSSSERRQSLWTVGRASSPSTCTNTARLSHSLGWGPGVHTPPSLSLLRSSSCHHWALKMSGPALGRL